MKISEKQLFMLIHILKETLTGMEISGQFTISMDDRRDLYTRILNQQSEVYKEINDKP